jgi:hypothetical protein
MVALLSRCVRVMVAVSAAAILILWIAVTFAGRSRWVMGFLR